MGLLLACLGAWGVAREARAQTVNDRLGTAPFARDALTRMPVQTRSDTPDVQHPVGFEPHVSKGMDRFHLVAAAEPVPVVAAGAAPRRQTGRPTLPNSQRNCKTPSLT